MKLNNFYFLYYLFIVFSSMISYSQDSLSIKRSRTIKTIWEIPHKSIWQKWMWIHRAVTFEVTKKPPLNYDTCYIKSYQNRLVITIPISYKKLQFSLIDFKSDKKLTFVPNQEYDFGVSLSSRWASFIVNTGAKLFSKDTDIKGETKYQDYQLNLYSRKITTDMFFQNYSGFYIKNSKSFTSYSSAQPYDIRSDVKAVNMGASTYYIVNHKRFTYKNSFTFVEKQKKSAGSILLGIYYSYFDAKGSPSLVTYPFKSNFDSLSFIRSGHSHNFGFNLGYIYTFVFQKKWYATASLVQGIGETQVSYAREDNSIYSHLSGGAGKLNVRFALGYDKGKYFIGTMTMFDYYLFRGNVNSTLDYSFGKFMIYAGYRFSTLKAEKKILKYFKLIDY